MEILVADPAGNITVFVLEAIEKAEDRAALARAILAEKNLGAEQVGFVFPPGSKSPLWHLEMAGGEFCGNAARCFGLYAARLQGLKGKAELFVSVSGAETPLRVEADLEKSRARAEMPKPLLIETIDYKGRPLPLFIFEGISHVIAPGLKPDRESFLAIKLLTESKLKGLFARGNGPGSFAALGVMFFDTGACYLHPAVHVSSTDTLVFESSCGSGAAAIGLWLCREMRDGARKFTITQPGGLIETEVIKKSGEISSVTIGGEVKLGECRTFPL